MTNAQSVHHSILMLISQKNILKNAAGLGRLTKKQYIVELLMFSSTLSNLTFSKMMYALRNPGHGSPFLKQSICFILSFLSVPVLFSQDRAAADSLQIYIQNQVESEVKQQLSWLYLIFGVAALLITIWGIVVWFFRIRKVAEQQIDKKAEGIIEEKISKKVGVKTGLIRSYFHKIEQEQALFNKRILVINATKGKRQNLEERLKKAGFQTTPIFWTLKEFQEKIEPNDFDLILFDNEDGLLKESELTKCIDAFEAAFRFVCFTSKKWSQENYQRYNSKVKFANDASYLGDAVRNALKESR